MRKRSRSYLREMFNMVWPCSEEISSNSTNLILAETSPVMVAAVDQIGTALGEPCLLVLPCAAAHLNHVNPNFFSSSLALVFIFMLQIIIDSFLVSLWKPKEGELENDKIA